MPQGRKVAHSHKSIGVLATDGDNRRSYYILILN